MHTSKRTGAVVCAIALGWVTSAVAVQPLEMTNAIVLESSTPHQLVVTGHNFNNGGTVQLTLGGTPLIVQSQTDTVLVADLPADILPGSYVLEAWSGNGAVREDSMDITIGAEGAAGPQGEPGPEGSQGPQGLPGADGTDGVNGLDGANCWDNIPGGTSTADCIGPKGAKGDKGDTGPEGPPGADGAPGSPGAPGQSVVAASLPVDDTNCPFGGTEFTSASGVDYACNGEPGPQGSPGANTPDRTAELCDLYTVLKAQNLISVLEVPDYCTTYAVGDVGPAGGIVFYITNDGVNGLEVMPEDLGFLDFGCGLGTGGTGIAIGDGGPNTDLIIQSMDQGGCRTTPPNTAPEVAFELTYNGFSDWFLPSLLELERLYAARAVVPGLGLPYYWSSSLIGTSAFYVDFVDGSNGFGDFGWVAGVRAIRAF